MIVVVVIVVLLSKGLLKVSTGFGSDGQDHFVHVIHVKGFGGSIVNLQLPVG